MITLLLFASLTSLWLTGKFPQLAVRCGLLDEPNQRSAHQVTKPRGAGIVFICTWIVAGLIAALRGMIGWDILWLFVPGILLIATVSLLDDRYTLRARTRFIVQLLSGLCLLASLGGMPDLNFGLIVLSGGILTSLLILIACLWSINLFNFMDGTDGLAGIEALFVLGGGSVLLFLAGAHELAWLALLLCAAIIGFLRWNWPDSRLFMGDVGSAPLGYIMVAFALAGQSYGIPLTLWFILYGVFIFDASLTLLRRLLAGQRWYESHNLHAYQRLCQSGWSQRQLLLASMVVNMVLFTLAFVGYNYPNWLWACIVAALLMLTTAYLLVEWQRPMLGVRLSLNENC